MAATGPSPGSCRLRWSKAIQNADRLHRVKGLSVSKLNVLVLHRMGPVSERREAVIRLENMFAEERPDLNIVTHDADMPFPKFVAEFPFDLVVLNSTFLGARTAERRLARFQEIYGPTVRSATFRVALPQDDYDSSALLDEWMVDWEIDRLYCVIPDRWKEIYPSYSESGTIVPGFTGYITNDWIQHWRDPKPRLQRRWDVTYRTHDLSAHRCDLRHLKFAISDRFLDAVGPGSGLQMDISSRAADHIAGPRWHDFIEESRFCLATPSGSSFLDPRGEARRCVAKLVAENASTTLADVRATCFPPDIPERPFSAISPRHIEAGLALTVQIATLGDYSGLMHPGEDYVALEEDCSNIQEVLDVIRDEEHCNGLAHNFRDRLLSEPRLQRTAIVDEIVTAAEGAVTSRGAVRPTQSESGSMLKKYATFVGRQGRPTQGRLWVRSSLISAIDRTAPRLGQQLRGNR